MALVPESTIEDLPLPSTADRFHRFPVMKDGLTGSLTVGMVLDLILGSTPELLDTLEKLAAAINDDPNFAGTMATQLGAKLDALQPFIDVAAASTVSLGAVASRNVRITGTTTITSFGVAAAGTVRNLRFAGALILTHNATSLILPNGGASIPVLAGDTLTVVSLGSGNWFALNYQRASMAGRFAVLQDQRASGTAGGANVTGWQTRTLNTETFDPDNIVPAPTANSFTPAVDCECVFESVTFQTGATIGRLWNVTDGVEVARSISQYSGQAAPGYSILSVGHAKVLAGKTYRVEVYCTTVQATNGLGAPAASGGVEVYCTVTLRGL
jgi:hypothetical protein